MGDGEGEGAGGEGRGEGGVSEEYIEKKKGGGERGLKGGKGAYPPSCQEKTAIAAYDLVRVWREGDDGRRVGLPFAVGRSSLLGDRLEY